MKMGALEFKALYDDLCSATSKVKVKNKSVIQVSRDQSRITSPIGNILIVCFLSQFFYKKRYTK
jgi:hypothetical protein